MHTRPNSTSPPVCLFLSQAGCTTAPRWNLLPVRTELSFGLIGWAAEQSEVDSKQCQDKKGSPRLALGNLEDLYIYIYNYIIYVSIGLTWRCQKQSKSSHNLWYQILPPMSTSRLSSQYMHTMYDEHEPTFTTTIYIYSFVRANPPHLPEAWLGSPPGFDPSFHDLSWHCKAAVGVICLSHGQAEKKVPTTPQSINWSVSCYSTWFSWPQ